MIFFIRQTFTSRSEDIKIQESMYDIMTCVRLKTRTTSDS